MLADSTSNRLATPVPNSLPAKGEDAFEWVYPLASPLSFPASYILCKQIDSSDILKG